MIDELERFADEQAEISRMKLLDNDKGLRSVKVQAFCLGLIAGVFIATVFALIV